MIQEAKYIDKKAVNPANTDFFGLRNEGIELLQQLSGHVWTNYNLHDPGLILLETLCFALTDLGYKSNFSLLEILKAFPEGDFKLEDNAFYNKKITFASHPVTFQDYSILFLDRLGEYINNVWIETILNSDGQEVGTLRAWLLVRNEWSDQLELIKDKVFKCYAGHRNLGEKLEEIKFLERKKSQIYVEVQIGYRISPEYIYALFMLNLEEHFLNPKLNRYTESELTEKGIPVDEIYEGPLTTRGYYNQRELSALPIKIKIESLIQLLFELDEGVKKVNNFKVIIDGEEYTDTIYLDHFLPLFDVNDMDHVFRFYQNEELFKVNLSQAKDIYKKLRQGENRTYDLKIPRNVNKDLRDVKKRDLQSFLPLEYDLPSVFGFQNPNYAKRRALKLKPEQQQLWEFLQIPNKFLADAHRKLANTAAFFSIYEKEYLKSLPWNSYEKTPKENLLKRNKTLDHLLSRFNINFPGLHAKQTVEEEKLIRILRAKEYCLQHIPEFTACRGKAANLEEAAWGTENIPVFSKWLHLFVGFTDFRVRSTTEAIVNLTKQLKTIDFLKEGISISQFALAGRFSSNYKVQKKKNLFKIWLVVNQKWFFLGEEKRLSKAYQKVNEFRKQFVNAFSMAQTFHVVEDSYYDTNSPFTISLYFPNWSPEMENNRLKEFVKKEVSEWLPAHLQARFYALPFEEMVCFESKFQKLADLEENKPLSFIERYAQFRF